MITVVIPTYKRPDLLERLLVSVSKQTSMPDEVIVVDDASGMDEEYRKCIGRYSDRFRRLVYLRNTSNSGAPYSRNRGIREARNCWIALVDDDDEWLPRKLEEQWKVAKGSDKRLGLIYTWTKAQGETGQQSSYISARCISGDGRKEILTTNFIMSASVLVRKSALIRTGLFDEELTSCQDWDMWTRLLLEGYHCAVVPEILTIYHRHGGESIGLSTRAANGYKQYLKKHFISILRYTSGMNILKKLLLFMKVGIFNRV